LPTLCLLGLAAAMEYDSRLQPSRSSQRRTSCYRRTRRSATRMRSARFGRNCEPW
jgi:hypothetical protein